ncbi:rare lipoprotein A-like double-psi beta-barrel protein [Rhizoctonia solani]|uniref:Rare lipoprotein A-like double-psi beta-barrel protein n=1 Tax=Rhizoctonia solani TaxID=456999 RepID=A0A8H8NU78_9AGAM|nr:rare lipoprotein A-like double-psi beta-barrel protein [Rhizoctonia solani]QRW18847.1 rare lipoprotein A-like double-psi beta-barrel protein [Rhizoctonia solani]
MSLTNWPTGDMRPAYTSLSFRLAELVGPHPWKAFRRRLSATMLLPAVASVESINAVVHPKQPLLDCPSQLRPHRLHQLALLHHPPPQSQPTTSKAEPTTSKAEPTTSKAEPTTSEAEPTTTTPRPTPAATNDDDSGSSSGATYTGEATFYDPALGSCGINSTNKDLICAVSHCCMTDLKATLVVTRTATLFVEGRSSDLRR